MSLLLASASSGIDPIEIVILVIGSGGLLGGVVTFLRLKPDMDTAAVTQAQGAAETLAIAHQVLVAERDAWRTRALDAEGALQGVQRALDDCERAHGRRWTEPGRDGS